MRSKKAILNIVTNLLLQVAIVIYGFIVPKVIITNFGSNINGLISSITQFLAYISLLESGFGPVVKALLYKPISKKNKEEITNILSTTEKFFKNIAKIFVIYMILLCFLYPLIVKNEFGRLYTISLIVIISISTFAEYFFGMTYKIYLQADQRGYIISLIQIITYIFNVTAVMILAKLGLSIQIIQLVSGLIFVLRPVLQNIYVKRMYNFNLKSTNRNYELKQKWDGLAQHIAAVVHNNTDTAILTIFSSLAEVSVYYVYYLIVKGIKSIIQAFTSGIDSIFGNMLAKEEYDNLKRKFNMYEVLYFTIITIIFSCTMVLIVPFVEIYTKGINDVNYIRPLFGYLIVISEFIWAIRLPYSTLTLAAGHFKETKKGAWVEAISNIIISTILVSKYGIVGVTIGTIIAMTLRTIEFSFHTSKYILKRSCLSNCINIMIMISETIIINVISNIIRLPDNNTYIDWITRSIVIFGMATAITCTINMLLFNKSFKELYKMIKNVVHKGVKKHEQN